MDITIVEFLPSGGMFHYAFQFGRALAEAGHRVRLITGPDPELRSSTPGLTVVSLLPTWHPNAAEHGRPLRRKVRRAWRALLLAESWRRVLVELRRHPPDLVQFGELRYMLDSAGLLAVGRFGGGAVVDVAHNPLPYDVSNPHRTVEKTGGLSHRLLARAYAACDLVLVLGEGPRDNLVKNFPGLARVAVCGHGDYSGLIAAERQSAPSEAPPRALLFGAWTRYKNIPLLLDAFALVRARLPEARLTLAGPVMPDVDLAALERRAAEIGGVELRPGYVPMEDLPKLFASHRVVVFTHSTVNVSGSVHMAYTFGRPVVATNLDSMFEVVAHGQTGLLADPEPESIAAALTRLLEDGALADRMGSAAVEYGRHGGSWSRVADLAVAAYRDALANRSRQAALAARR